MASDQSRLRDLFLAACDLPPEQQLALIDEECRDDPALQAELKELLHLDQSGGGILGDDHLADLHMHMGGAAVQETPKQIGPYEVKRLLGEGGMGLVWLAEQEHPKREVAVKVIRAGLLGRELTRRFEVEVAVLARLKHPGIAQIYDAGMFDDGAGGRPFFAMEYIEGESLHDFVKSPGLGPRTRLELFIRICDAVQHAHQKGVVHRDLKPGNIVVTPEGQPKVLDFGVARATDSDLHATTLTDGTRLVGTLAYMSPEQIEGHTGSVDTRSDVYALGVILYELLAGRLPHNLKGQTIAKAARVIVEDEPAPLSSIDRSYRGDLNTIVLKSLEKDPERRYQSAAELAEDIRRYLSDQPITARPATATYQLRKFARRNKALVGGIAVAVLALAVGATAAVAGMVRAQRQAERAESMNTFLESVLIAADTARSGDVRLVDLLRDASDRVDDEFAEYPDLAVRVHRLLAVAFFNITLYDECEVQARRWVETLERGGAGRDDILDAQTWVAMAMREQNRLPEAEQIVRQVIDESSERPAGAVSMQARTVLGDVLSARQQYEEAETVLRAVIRDAEGTRGRFDRVTIRPMMFLARTLDNRSMHTQVSAAQWESLTSEAIGLFERVIQDETQAAVKLHDGIHARLRLSGLHLRRGEADQSLRFAQNAHELTEQRVGPDHPLMFEVETQLGRALDRAGRSEEAASITVGAIERLRKDRGDSVRVIVGMTDALSLLDAAREWQTALDYARSLSARFPADAGHGGFGTAYLIWVPYLQTRLGDVEAAGPLLDDLSASESTLDDLSRAGLYYARGVWHAEQGQTDLARLDFERSLPLCGTEPHHWPRREAVQTALEQLRPG